MHNTSVLLEIRSRHLNLNPAFQKVADYFLNNSFTEYVEISNVTEATGVSKATVSRFVQELGYNGYKSFQMDLIRANLANEEGSEGGYSGIFGYRDVTGEDSTVEIGRKVFRSNIKALEDTLEMVDFSVLDKMMQQIEKDGRFYIFASGRSIIAADSLCKRLVRLNVCCHIYNDPHDQALASTIIKPDDLVLGISAYGRSSSVLRAMQRGMEKGALVVGLTSHRGTPIEQVSNHMLYTVTSDSIFGTAEPSCTTVTHVALLDCLYMMLVMRDPKPVRKLLEEGAEAMEGERVRTR